MVDVERLGKQLAQPPRCLFPIARVAAHQQIRRKFAHRLPARPARGRRLLRLTGNRNLLERRKSLRDSGGNRNPLCAQCLTVCGVLDVTAGDDLSAGSQHRRPNAKARVWSVCILHRGEGGVPQPAAFNPLVGHRAVSSERNDWPAPRYETPSQCPTVAPRSEKVGRTPRSTGTTAGPSARRGTRSRAWSVDGVVGSLPWSAVMKSRSSSLSGEISEGKARSNSLSAR